MRSWLLHIIILLCPFFLFGQGGDNAASAAASPITLPFYSTTGTTVGKADDYNNPAGFASAYTTGPDYLYYYCATADGSISTQLTYTTTGGGVHPSISVWEGVPGAGGTLVSSVTSPGDNTVTGSLKLEFNAQNGHCYYIMIDNWPNPNGFAYTISVYTTPINAACSNIGFENNNFSGWVGTYGVVSNGLATDPYPVYKPTSFTTSAPHHTLTSAGNDPVVGAAIPMVCPGLGSYSMRLGDGTGVNSKGASIEQRFSVSAANAQFTYYYAVVLQDNGHPAYQQPMFKVDVYDCNGNALSCGDYLVVAGAGIPGFNTVAGSNPPIYYKTWTPVFVDLTPYIGSCVTVKFTVGDCTQGGHYGYAYIDADCQSLNSNTNPSVCQGQTTSISAYAGAASYSWTIQGDPTVIGTTQTISVSPAVTTTYECAVTNVSGCVSTFTSTVTVNPNPVTSGITAICPSTTLQLSATNNPHATTPWTTNDASIATISNTGLVTGVSGGTVNIIYTDENGCTDTDPMTIYPIPTINGATSLDVCHTTSTQLTGSQTPKDTNPWVSSNTAVATVSNTGLVTGLTVGTTNITYTTSDGCVTTQPLTVHGLPTLTPGPISICQGATSQFSGSGTPHPTQPYTSSDTDIATVDNTGLVTGISPGVAIITYIDNNGCTDTAAITIKPIPSITGAAAMCENTTAFLNGTGVGDPVAPWSSSNNLIASISSAGLVHAISPGVVTITRTLSNGCSATFPITVNQVPAISGPTTVCVGSSIQLTADLTPNPTTPWYSSNNALATVSSTGLVTGVTAGNVTINFVSDQGCENGYPITVNALPTITGTISICLGGTSQLTGTGTPAAVNPWVSSNTAVATVSNTGLVTAVSAGVVTITYTLSNGCAQTTSFTVNPTPTISGTLATCVNATTQLLGSQTPNGTTPWISSNNAVATISSTGLVTGLVAGSTTITYMTDAGCTNTALVSVNPLPTIAGTTTVCVNSTTQLTGSGTAHAVTPWISSNTAIATVSNTGLVTGVSAGSATITYTNNNGCQKTAVVTVYALPTITGTLSICAVGSTQLTGSATANGVNPWISSNTGVATISNTGLVTAVAQGSTTITYTNTNNCQVTAVVTVAPIPTISGTTNVCAGAQTQLTGSGTPNGTTPWISSNTGVATINSAGLVTGVSAGSATMTYTDNFGCQTTVVVSVNAQPTISGTLFACVGQSVQLSGSGVADATTPWSSSDILVATISNTGLVTAQSGGTTTITYMIANGCTTTETFTVYPTPTISGTLAVCIGNTSQLLGTQTPDAVTPWISSNTGIATISNTGLVTAVSAGTTTITYTTNAGCTNTATVTVNPLPTINGTLTVCVNGTTQLTGSATANGVSPWVSSDPTIATISATGLLTGISSGNVTITYTNSNSCQTTANITVNPLPTITGTLSICAVGSTQLTGSATANGVNPWVSSNLGVATISNTGLVTAVAQGTTTITYTNTNNCQITATVTVAPIPTISGTTTVCAGNQTQLTGSGTPNGVNPWISSNTGVATISNLGLVSAVVAGSSTITYTDNFGCQTTTIVTVNALPTISGILTACEGATSQLAGSGTAAAVSPWTSSNAGIASISNTGLVSAHLAGNSTITYTNNNGCSITANFVVNPTPTISGTLTACIGTTTQLTGSQTPHATTPWVSSNTAVATISNTGLVTGILAGSTTITYMNSDGCSVTASVTINALPTISGTANVCVGSTVTLTGSATPHPTTPWQTSDATVATISNAGLVTGIKAGTVTITYTNTNGCQNTLNFTVNPLPSIAGNLALCMGEATELAGINAPHPFTPWVSSNTAVATVSNVGIVTSVAPGSATITYTDVNSCQVSALFTVNPPSSVSGPTALCVNEQIQLTGTGTPNAVFPWQSSNIAIATISNLGLVTGLSAGSVIITYTDNNGCQSTYTVTVNPLPTISGIATLCVNATSQLTGSGTAHGVTPWLSSNPAIATVSNTGLVTALAPGTTTITYKLNTGCTTTLSITVNDLPVINGSLAICLNGSTQLSGTGVPHALTPWVSSVLGVATVSNTGLVSGVSGGNSLITYTDVNGCQSSVNFVVNPLPVISGTLAICLNGSSTLSGTNTPHGTTPWVSSDPLVATINNAGVITTLQAGTTTITYTDVNGCQSTALVTVNPLPTISGILAICADGSTQLTGSATAHPTTPWVSSNTGVATISNTGLVTAVSAGTTTITYTNNNGCQATTVVTVNPLPSIAGTTTFCETTTSQLSGTGTAALISPWVSSNTAVATITNLGLATGVAAGNSVITFTDNNGCQTTSTLTINSLPTISGTLAICNNATSQLSGSATAHPTTPWISSNTAVATISNTGLVSAISAGTTTITYTNTNGCQQTATFTVYALPSISGPVSTCINSSIQLSGSTLPNGINPWLSGNSAVATIANDGTINGISSGNAVMTYTDVNGCQATQTITINNLPTITGTAVVCVNSTTQLTGSGTANATTPWISSNTAVATVSNVGLITGVSAGSSTITYTDANGCQEAIVVTVNPLPIISGTLSACVGASTQLTGNGVPNGITPWISSNTAVATITNTGLVAGLTAGTSTITYTNNNACSITTIITINPLPSISGTLSACVGGVTQLGGSGTPDPTTPWTISDALVASVTNTGLVNGIIPGNVTITYTNNNGCQITANVVINPLPVVSGTAVVCAGSTTQLAGNGTPNATTPWISSNTLIATVNNVGLVSGVSFGSATITYTNDNGCQANYSVTVNPLPVISGNLYACINGNTQLTGNGTPDPTTPWVSSNTTVATISNTGMVTGMSAGTTQVTYTNSNGCQITETVTINPLPIISGSSAVCVNNTLQLTGNGTPHATNPWASSDNLIGSVSNTGLITGISAGNVVITYMNSNNCQISTNVTVHPLPIVNGTLTTCINASAQLNGNGVPAIANAWISSNTAIATISNVGLYTGISAGSTSITYTNNNGCQQAVTITVNPLPVISGTFAVCLNGTTQLSGNGTPDAVLPWTSSNIAIATVSNTGFVTGVGVGTATISYMNSNGCIQTETITVNPLPIITGSLSVCVNGATQLLGDGTANASNPWASSNNSLATVSSTGLVNAITAGNVAITYTNNNGCQQTSIVTVNPLPIISGTLAVCLNSTTQLSGNGTAHATTPWVSSNPSIAAVDNNGLVTGIGVGTTTITYTNTNGCQQTASITVNALPTISGTLSACINATTQLSGSATANAGNPWVSSNLAVATISNTGLVTGISAGTSIITYTNSNGCTIATTVTINPLPIITGISSICLNNTSTLSGDGTPNGTNPWMSNNPLIATINSSGLITANAAGSVTIVYTNSNGCQQTTSITVNPLPIISGTANVCVNATTQLAGDGTAAVINPWVSANTSIATVNNLGLVTGVSAGTVAITYTNSNGCQQSINVLVNPLPIISGNSMVCVNSTIQLTGNGTAAAINPWISANTAIASVSSNGLVTGIASGNVAITYTNSNGCQQLITITVNPLPIINGILAVCENSTTQLTGNGTPSLTNPWVISNPLIATVNSTGLVTGVLGGTTTITYTNNLQCSNSATVQVNSLPVISGTLAACMNSTTQLTGNGTPAAVNPWVSSNSLIASINSSGFITGHNYGTVNITYTDNNGCSKTAPISVFDLPVISGATALCANSSTQLSGSVLPFATSPWVTSDPTIATISSTGLISGIKGGVVAVFYKDQNGCVQQKNITVNALPIISGPSTLCASSSIQLSATGTPKVPIAWVSSATNFATVDNTGKVNGLIGGTSDITFTDINSCSQTKKVTVFALPIIDGASFVCAKRTTEMIASNPPAKLNPWSSSNSTVATIDSIGQVKAIKAGVVILTYVDSNGCTSTYPITIKPTPTANFTATNIEGCVPVQVDFNNTSTGATDFVKWIYGDGSSASFSSSDTISHNYYVAGKYDVSIVVGLDGCYDTLKKNQLVSVNPIAIANFSVDKTETTIIDPTFSLTNLSKDASIFNWTFDDMTSSTLKDPIHSYVPEEGSYTIRLFANNIYNCPSTIEKTVKINDELIFYVPNAFTPNGDNDNQYFTPVFYSGYNPDNFVMYIFNRWGEVIFETHDPAKGWNGRYGGPDGIVCQDDMYVWKIEYSRKGNMKTVVKTGHVILLK